jgi:ubiquinone/menaquinone biosynthesis C-methylase UbiE
VGFYAERVLPHLIDLAMRHRTARERRAALIPRARGLVVEIGIGSGHNLPFYANAVTRVVGVDPSAPLLAMTGKRHPHLRFPLELLQGSAEDLPLPTASVDTAISTWTLCSVPDAARALAEIHRVLKPGGTLHFIEHGRSPDPAVQRWQDRLNGAWGRVAGGCHINRDMGALVRGAGFSAVAIDAQYLPGSTRVVGYHYEGSAKKSPA